MDVTEHRRIGGAKYGKNRNKMLFHDLFSSLNPKPDTISSSARLPISPSSPSTEQQQLDDFTPRPPSPTPSNRPAHITSHSSSPHVHKSAAKSTSPAARHGAPTSKDDVSMSMFDIISSDEEQDKELTPVNKKRKLTHTTKAPAAASPASKALTNKSPITRKVLTDKQHNKTVKVSSDKQPFTVPAKVTKAHHTSISTAVSKITSKTISVGQEKRDKVPATKRKTYSRKITQTAESRVPSSVAAVQSAGVFADKLPATSLPTVHESPGSPRSEHNLRDEELTINDDTQSESQTKPETPLLPEKPLSRGGKRLIDRLDAPRKTISHAKSLPAATESNTKSSTQPSQDPAQPGLQVPSLNRSTSSRTRPTYGRARSTYAKERSHLADMVDDLDALSTASSQEASQQLASQLAVATQPSQLQMELDFESDSSGTTGVGKIKSIHELRQAGSNNRFDRDLEAYMEDIDPTSKSSSKALRLQALMKLVKRMSQEDFTVFVSDRGVDRLASWCSTVKDVPSRLLLSMVLWRLTHSKNSSATKLKTIVDSMLANSKLLTNLSTMTEIVKDRKENLSKSMIADMVAFQEDVLFENLLPYQSKTILPAAVVTGTLNDSLRRLRGLGGTVSTNKHFYMHAFTLLQLVVPQLQGERSEHIFVVGTVLSVLEICTASLDAHVGALHIDSLRLGQSLATIMHSSLDKHEHLVQSALKFAISYGNNRPEVCLALTNSEFIQSLMAIVDNRFLRLVEVAESGKHVEQEMLDSIILCLACLLNLTEHEDELRRRIAHSQLKSSDGNTVKRLVHIYRSAAPKLVETTNEISGQMLPAFGYLSLLLCSLSLAEDVRSEMELLLGDLTMADVVASGGALLTHLRTVEDMLKVEVDEDMDGTGEKAVDGFTQRFGQILAAVQVG